MDDCDVTVYHCYNEFSMRVWKTVPNDLKTLKITVFKQHLWKKIVRNVFYSRICFRKYEKIGSTKFLLHGVITNIYGILKRI